MLLGAGNGSWASKPQELHRTIVQLPGTPCS
jgi:hypothetical protein